MITPQQPTGDDLDALARTLGPATYADRRGESGSQRTDRDGPDWALGLNLGLLTCLLLAYRLAA